jgi:hypothetical protein
MLATPLLAQGAQPWQLLQPTTATRATAASPGAIEAMRVAVDPEAFAAETAALDLMLIGGQRVRAVRQSSDWRAADDFTWRGWVDGDPEQQVTLTRVGEHLAAHLSLRSGIHELTPTHDGPLLLRIDSERFPECGGAEHAPTTLVQADAGAARSPVGGAPVIDVLIVVSPSSTAQLGGQPQALAFAQSAVDSANTAYQNSQMVARLRLVGVRFTARADSGSSATDLSWLRSNAEVAGWRNQLGADMVGMISEFSNACGQGYLMGSPPGAGFAPNAYQVSARSCAVGNLTYAHEHGHNMGFQHDPGNGSGSAFPYAYGHFVDGSYRTVMSYSTGCTAGCARRPYFSNPNVSFLGAATGIADQRDNARAGNQTAAIVAAFRAESLSLFTDGFE